MEPGHAPYGTFIESLLNVTDTSTPDGKNLFELFVGSAADEADETTLTLVEKGALEPCLIAQIMLLWMPY
ncbi:unnamed protein product [Calypogeia fissa]